MGLLASALARPRSGYYASLSEQAAALLESLANNHAFIDGNKRVAFTACAMFLLIIGYRLRCTAEETERFVIDEVIVARAGVAAIAPWLEGHMLATS